MRMSTCARIMRHVGRNIYEFRGCRAILTAELTYPPAIKSHYYCTVTLFNACSYLRYNLLCMQLSFKYITGEGPPLHDNKIVPSKPKTNFKKPQKQPYGSKYTV